MSSKRTAMNFAMHFATSVANFILVIGRLLAVKSVVGICDGGETRSTQTGWVFLFYLQFPGRAPDKLGGKIDQRSHWCIYAELLTCNLRRIW